MKDIAARPHKRIQKRVTQRSNPSIKEHRPKRMHLPFIISGFFVVFSIIFLIPLALNATLSSVQASEYTENDTQEESAQHTPLLSESGMSDATSTKLIWWDADENGMLISHESLSNADGSDAEDGGQQVTGEISTYVVAEGDTLSGIAKRFHISSNTILWANNIKNPNQIRPGMELVILPMTGVLHKVQKGDTISAIAKKYKGDEDEILSFNMLEDGILVEGSQIMIPGGSVSEVVIKKSASSKKKSSSGVVSSGSGSSGFVNPAPGARKSQGIHGYNAVDLAAPEGTPIRAASGGKVIVSLASGYNGGYGQYVVIRHSNGVQTLYAHLSQNEVSVGESVEAGQIIGRMGNTGRSTGPHLHFEVRGAVNPF